jgi:replicative DNA helicase
MSELSSLKLEKYVLSGILRNESVFWELEKYINEYDFTNKTHEIIFTIARDFLIKKQKLDNLLIAQKIKDLNIQLQDNIDIFEYIKSIAFLNVTYEATIEYAKELEKLRVCRELEGMGQKIVKSVHELTAKSVDEIVQGVDKVYHEKISLYRCDNEPLDLTESLHLEIEEKAKSPVVEIGIPTPYENFNKMFGGLRDGGNIYAFVSRAGDGKTTILTDIVDKICEKDENCIGLMLDTEMETVDIKYRRASRITRIPSWYLESGNWIKVPEYKELYYKNKEDLIKSQHKRLKHMVVGGKTIDSVCSIIRRWYYKNYKPGIKATIVYDYIKLTGEKDGDKKEYQLIGDKVNKLKELSLELSIRILTACQLNRSAISGIDDASAIAQSDRLQWFASFVAIFRKKTIDEINIDGLQFGTHKLIPLKTRFQGRESYGHTNLIKVSDHHTGKFKYFPNFINYEVDNFNVKECGTLKDIIDAQHLHVNFDKNKDENDDALLD